jgi:hypothetical protein
MGIRKNSDSKNFRISLAPKKKIKYLLLPPKTGPVAQLDRAAAF